MCAWCFSRGGRVLILFIKYMEQMASKECRDPTTIEALKGVCKCPSCTARKLWAYREERFSGQKAPIDVRG